MKTIAILSVSNALDNNPRVMRIALSLKNAIGCNVSILAMSSDKHLERGITSYGVPYGLIPRIKPRALPSKVAKHFSECLFYFSVRKSLKNVDFIWMENVACQYVALFTKKPVIWDLMEIPDRYLSVLGSKMFGFLERKCVAVSHANKYRIDYLLNQGVIRMPKKHFVLHNYADSLWKTFEGPVPDSYKRFRIWTGGEKFVYLQGLSSDKRYPYETITSVLKSEVSRIVVAGGLCIETVERLDTDFPDWRNRVYLTGMIPHDDLKWFTKGSLFSLVFYTYNHPNNRFCEPNRLYQCLSLGVPVIVGKNEPMSDFVNISEFPGVIIDGDGRNTEENLEAIHRLLQDYESFKKKAEAFKDVLCWGNQVNVVKNMLECSICK